MDASPTVLDGGESRLRVLRACDRCSQSKQRCDGERPCINFVQPAMRRLYEKLVRKRGRRRRPKPASVAHRALAPGPPTLNNLINPIDIHNSPENRGVVMHRRVTNPLSSPSGTEDVSSRLTIGTGDNAGSNEQQGRSDQLGPGPSLTGFEGHRDLPNPFLFQDALFGLPGRPSSQIALTPGRIEHWLDRMTPIPRSVSRGLYSTVSHKALQENLNVGLGQGRQSYPCLEPLLPYLQGIISAKDASEMLEIYFNEQRNTIFKATSPYTITHVIHPSSVLHPTSPRPTSSVLLLVMLLCVAQTADIKIFDPPGARQRIVLDLYRLAMDLMEPIDWDNYFRTSDGWQYHPGGGFSDKDGRSSVSHAAGSGLIPDFLGSTDAILAMVILTLVVSGGHFKADCLKWLSKATRLARASGLSMEDEGMQNRGLPNQIPQEHNSSREWLIVKEERRRLFWLIYCLDRHLALSFNAAVHFPEGTFCVAAPLPEAIWQSLERVDLSSIPVPCLGPPARITGYGFFEYFLPLATVLGHIIDYHHIQNHPLLGDTLNLTAIHRIETLISQREQDLAELQDQLDSPLSTRHLLDPLDHILPYAQSHSHSSALSVDSKKPLVIAYSSHMLHVFYILLHGKWDPISMIEDKDDWITSDSFQACASHALSATAAVHQILTLDPELTFMPYLFGIYLLQGSFILLLFVDRMPELGFNKSVEEVCETIIRAHEVSVVTLDTTFQKNIRKVFRSMLHDAQRADPHFRETHKARRREILSLYRWTRTSHGLAY
ncbi:Zn(II)2Cys6 transcription factor [Aspergillus undulatus]|uniref:Zn(II)2Cys6 transcription factor n=1 Tax=Aspergillus undulatus TaxID=1810928 RepID=UPI003CCDD9EB